MRSTCASRLWGASPLVRNIGWFWSQAFSKCFQKALHVYCKQQLLPKSATRLVLSHPMETNCAHEFLTAWTITTSQSEWHWKRKELLGDCHLHAPTPNFVTTSLISPLKCLLEMHPVKLHFFFAFNNNSKHIKKRKFTLPPLKSCNIGEEAYCFSLIPFNQLVEVDTCLSQKRFRHASDFQNTHAVQPQRVCCKLTPLYFYSHI